MLKSSSDVLNYYKENKEFFITFVICLMFVEYHIKMQNPWFYEWGIQITIDNTKNNGGKRVPVCEAVEWNYKIDENIMFNLLNLLENEYRQGNINKEELSAIGGRISTFRQYESERIKQITNRIDNEIHGNELYENQGSRVFRMGMKKK